MVPATGARSPPGPHGDTQVTDTCQHPGPRHTLPSRTAGGRAQARTQGPEGMLVHLSLPGEALHLCGREGWAHGARGAVLTALCGPYPVSPAGSASAWPSRLRGLGSCLQPHANWTRGPRGQADHRQPAVPTSTHRGLENTPTHARPHALIGTLQGLVPTGAVCRHRWGTRTTQAAGGAQPRAASTLVTALLQEKTPEAPWQFGRRGAARWLRQGAGGPQLPWGLGSSRRLQAGRPWAQTLWGPHMPLPLPAGGCFGPHSWSLSQLSPILACVTQPLPAGHLGRPALFPLEPGPGPPPGQRQNHQL